MSRNELIKLSIQGLCAWIALSALGWYFAEFLGKALLPLFKLVFSFIASDYSAWISLVPDKHDFQIQLSARNLHPIHFGDSQSIATGQVNTVAIHLLHTMVPIIIELSILLAWPVQSFGQRLVLILLGVISSLLVVALTGPVILAGKTEIVILELAAQAHEERPEPWVVTWMIFCEMGGRWLLAVLAAIFSINVQRQICKPTQSVLPKN